MLAFLIFLFLSTYVFLTPISIRACALTNSIIAQMSQKQLLFAFCGYLLSFIYVITMLFYLPSIGQPWLLVFFVFPILYTWTLMLLQKLNIV